MGKVRVFYGHEGVVPPTGSKSRSAALAQPEEDQVEADEIVADDLSGEPVEIIGEPVEDDADVTPAEIVRTDGTVVEAGEDGIPVLTDADEVVEEVEDADEADQPDESWTVGEIEEWAETHEIDLTGHSKSKKTRLARISEALNKGE